MRGGSVTAFRAGVGGTVGAMRITGHDSFLCLI